MKREDLIALLAEVKAEAISVATMQAIPPWHAHGGAERRHLDNVGCMGGAASIGLGLALAQPARKVMVIDGDGSLLMQLGGLASVAGTRASNFYHFVLVNRVYETSGQQSIPSADTIDFAGLARSAGYDFAERFDDLGVLRERLPGVLDTPGPAMIALEIDREEQHAPFPRIDRVAQLASLRAELTAG